MRSVLLGVSRSRKLYEGMINSAPHLERNVHLFAVRHEDERHVELLRVMGLIRCRGQINVWGFSHASVQVRKLPRQADSSKGDWPAAECLGRNGSGGTRPRLSWGRSRCLRRALLIGRLHLRDLG